MELAVATHTAPAAWEGADDRTLATAVHVLSLIAEEAQRGQ